MLHLVITLAAALFTLLLTASMLGPVALRFARPQIWSRTAGASGANPHTHGVVQPSFEPLDLGPDPVRWPSENPWPATARPELPWPSTTWNDPHFGQHWRTHGEGGASDAAFEAAQQARRTRAVERRNQDEAERTQRSKQKAKPKPQIEQVAQPPLRQKARNEVQRIQKRAQKAQHQVRESVGRAAAAAVDEVLPGASSTMAQIPSPPELEQMVAQIGLAGTVQEIMKRTGWDFKTAAQHLAKARRGR